jgi:hypothetical protein
MAYDPAAPQGTSEATIAAVIHRVSDGSGTTLVSSGVPLVSGLLFNESDLDRIRVVVNGAERRC